MDLNQDWKTYYPRPQLKRNSFYSLNGTWKLNGSDIEIPFPPQAMLSKYQGDIDDKLIYTKSFVLSNDFYDNKHVLLHFGAVDQIATVYLNDYVIGKHEGGYLPFYFDVTNYLSEDENILRVEAIDTLDHNYPYGKQRKDRGGMWYTPVSGIWQSVWMEAVPKDYIETITLTPRGNHIHIEIVSDASIFTVKIVDDKTTWENTYHQKEIDIDLTEIFDEIHWWSDEDPYLYNLYINSDHDHIESYFAMRNIKVQNVDGYPKVCLNGKPIFLHGVLDQGYFDDGLYIPKSPLEYKHDILRMKELGFNVLRKHIKIEPEAFYYYCDKYGMIVLQDMVNNGNYNYLLDTVLPNIGFQRRYDKLPGQSKKKEVYEKHLINTMHHLYNHPCILIYTLFNEGWGQIDSDKMYNIAKKTDPTRLMNSTSGWFAQKESDFDSRHVYFRNEVLKPKRNKVLLLSECGGYKRAIEGHMFNESADYGYGDTDSEEDLTNRIIKLYQEMVLPSLKNGLCGCIYTQLSDVEDEINGIYTFDRNICKVNKKRMQSIADKIKEEFFK